MKGKILFIAVCLSLSSSVAAQGCPAGIPAGNNPLCIPPSNPNSPYYRDSGGAANSIPVERWENRWGAFAIDLKAGLGASKSMRSKRAAQTAAMSECRRKGGTSCKVELTYFNQCGVIVAGAKTFSTSAAPTVARATEIGMDTCRRSGDQGCYVYFSDCSPAELVR